MEAAKRLGILKYREKVRHIAMMNNLEVTYRDIKMI